MPYTYDVFISYKRDPVRNQWLDEHFIPLFSHAVREGIAAECERQPTGIFFDRAELTSESLAFDHTGIEPGDVWRDALRTAMKASRCMVGLWSPLYFHSEWCLTEWNTFRTRPGSVVVPASVFDGRAFPPDARALQTPDFANFVIIGAGFKEVREYPEFQKRVRSFAMTVARRVRRAPAFQDWPIPDDVHAPPDPHIPQQRL
jgi:hypothetical protein